MLTLAALYSNRPVFQHIQIYGCFFPWLLNEYLESSLHILLVAMLDKPLASFWAVKHNLGFKSMQTI